MRRPKILLVDDGSALVEAIRAALEGAGYDCVHAPSAARALEILPRERPDLVILEALMGEAAEGFRVAYKIRSPEAGPDVLRSVPILMLSDIGRRTGLRFDRATDGDSLPVNEFLEMPVPPAVVLEKVRALLEKRTEG